MTRIMLVDDEENILRALRRSLSLSHDEGTNDDPPYQIALYTSPLKALKRAQDGVPFDLVMSDYRMPEMDGVAFLKAFREIQPDAVRLILSGHTDMSGLIGAINDAHIYRFITKPWEDYALRADIRQALQFQSLLSENQRLADQLRHQQGIISQQELELRRLEAETPGITKVRRGPDGSVLF